jgi:hypothetical protein
MRHLIFAFLFFSYSTPLFAQDSASTRFGLGYAIGSSSGIDLSWNCPHHQIDLLINGSYATQNQAESIVNGSYVNYQTTTESASIGLNYFWLSNLDKNFSLIYGPGITFGGTEIKTQTPPPAINGNSTISYFTTHIGVGVGPQYWFNSHFVVQGLSTVGVNIVGNSNVSSSAGYPYPSSTSYFIGGSVSIRYLF